MPSEVLEFFRETEPRFKEVSDDELTEFIAETKPEFLQDGQFAKRAGLVAERRKPVTALSREDEEGPPIPIGLEKGFSPPRRGTVPIPGEPQAIQPPASADVTEGQGVDIDISDARRKQFESTTQGGPPIELPTPRVAMAALESELPEISTVPRISIPSPQPVEGENVFLTVGKEALNIAKGIPEFLTSDVGIASIPAAALAPVVVAGAFTVDMLHSLGQQIVEVVPNWSKLSKTQQAVAVTDIVGTGLMAGMIASHGITKATGIRAPLTRGLETQKANLSKDLAFKLGQTEPSVIPSGPLPLTRMAVRAMEGKVEVPKTALPPEAKVAVVDIPPVRAEDFIEPGKPREGPVLEADEGPLKKVIGAEEFVEPKKEPTGLTADQEYDASLEAFKEASKAFTKIQEAYRRRQIGDDEFIAGKEAFDDAQTVADVAERKFIEAKNAATPPVAEQSLTAETPVEVRGEAKAKEPWEMSRSDFIGKPTSIRDMKASAKRLDRIYEHEASVEAAIARGDITSHPDYPDLKPQVKAEAKPVTPAQAAHQIQAEVQPIRIPKSATEKEAARLTKERTADAKRVKEELISRIEKELETALPAEAMGYNTPRIQIDIPGDGSFNIIASKENLQDLLRRAKRISTDPGGKEAKLPRGALTASENSLAKQSERQAEQKAEADRKERKAKTPIEPLADAVNEKHLQAWLEDHYAPEDIPEIGAEIRNFVRANPDVVERNSWTQIQEMAHREQVDIKAQQQKDLQMEEKPKLAKWTSATAELGGELYAGIPNPIAVAKSVASLAKHAAGKLSPQVKRGADYVADLADEIMHAGKMTEYRAAVLNWSAKLQRSFGEASDAQREIQSKVPKKVRREGITNWIQAAGDPAVLTTRRDATTNPKLKAGYQAALDLTPNEISVAGDVKAAYDAFGVRGQAHGVLNSFLDDYVTQIWNLNKGPATGSSRTLRDKFRFAKARSFDTFFDGEQAGYVPKTKDISELLPVYLHEMNSVIAARQLAKELHKATATDGEPMVQMRGSGTPVDGPSGQATLIMPKASKPGAVRYRVMENQPALHDWIWASKDTDGKPIFLKADMALHPEAYDKLKSVLGRSAIREWYETRTSLTANIPRYIAKGIDMANAETKRTMLGFFAPFHQVQEGTHAVGHRINPFFGIPKIDLVGNAGQLDAARHGLMLLPDRASANQFMEGFRVSGLVSRIPVLGPLADHYSHYLFHEYIPGLKFKTYEAIFERNQKVYAKDISSGKATLADVKHLSAEQANAAYGHLNYADLGRNPTIQHIAQLGLLAPDFLEARGRFAGQAAKGVPGSKVGREQLIALATLAIAQATLAWTGAKLTGGGWDEKNPFEFHVGSRKYTMRSVPEDIVRGVIDPRAFWHNRISPLIGKGIVQGLSGTDWRGQKVTLGETAKELASQPIPLTLRSATKTSKSSLAWWEQLTSAAGIKISRYNPRQELNDLHRDFLKNNPDPKVVEDFERNQKATYPVSAYSDLDNALRDRNDTKAIEAIKNLRESGRKDFDIMKRMRPGTVTGLPKPLFHETRKMESDFVETLDANGKALYEKAKADRIAGYEYFLKVWDKVK